MHFDSSRPVDPDAVRRMMHIIRHRGPDDEGIYLSRNVGLGFRRLSIIDLETGNQPISNETGSVWVIMNGEIYNHRELRSELQSLGHVYKTKGDTESLLHAYEQWGLDGISRANGMFAFAIWDESEQLLILGRDRVGKKPLYYAVENKTLYFGSEIKALFAGGLHDRTILPEALSDFLTFLFIPAPKTMFRSVRKLRPGHLLLVSDGVVTERQYWELRLPEHDGYAEYASPDQYVQTFSNLLQDSVKLRLISDVPLGSFLSGGLDSSSIVGIMRRHNQGPVKTFSVGYSPVVPENRLYDERLYARYVARQLGTEHYEVEVAPDDLVLLDRLVYHLDEPMADISVLPTFKLSQLAREHVAVALSGDGSDEMLLGYGKHLSELLSRHYLSLPSLLRRYALQPLARFVPEFHWKLRKFKIAFRHLDDPFVDRALRLFSIFQPETKNSVFNPDFLHTIGDYDTLSVFRNLVDGQPQHDTVNVISYLDFKLRLVDQLLLKLDKISMSVSLECRAPFLDHRLLEYVVRVPPSIRLHLLTRKYLLKQAAKQWVPHSVLRRKKQGFGFPLAAWIKHGVTKYFHDILLDETTWRRGYFQRSAVERLLREAKGGEPHVADTIVVLTFFELWCRQFIDRNHRR